MNTTILTHILRELTRHEGLALLVGALLTSAGIVCVAAAAAAILRQRSARARSLVWRMAMAALLIAGVWKVVPDVSPPVAVMEWRVEWDAAPVETVTAPMQDLPAIVLPEEKLWEKGADGLDGWAVSGWLSVAAAWMLWRVIGVGFGLQALARRSDDAPENVARVGEGIGLPPRTRYRLVDGLGSPMLTGWRKPVIWLPAEAAEWDAARLDAVLRHEAAHWRRGDWMWQWLAQATLCLWWWQPLVWLARRRLRIETEHAADDLAVDGAGQAADYARTLVEIAAGLPSRMRGGLGVTMFGHDGVKQRVQALMRANRWRGRIGLGALVALAVVTVALGVLVATKVEFSPQKPMYRSIAKLVAGGPMAATGTMDWREKMQDFYGTIIETLESEQMRKRTLGRVRALHPNQREGEVEIRVEQAKSSAVFSVLATGDHAEFTKIFLDALLDEFIAFRQSIREQTQGKAVFTFLQETVKQRKLMDDKLKALSEFQAANGPLISGGSPNERLSELAKQRQELKMAISDLKAEASDIPSFVADAEAHATAANPLTPAQAEHVKAAAALRTQEGKLQNMRRTHKPDHPELELLEAQSALARAHLELAEGVLKDHLKRRLAKLERQLSQVEEQMAEQRVQDVDTQAKLLQKEMLRVDAETTRQAYEKMMAGAEALHKTTTLQSDYVAIMERASTAKALPKEGMLPVWKIWNQALEDKADAKKTAAVK